MGSGNADVIDEEPDFDWPKAGDLPFRSGPPWTNADMRWARQAASDGAIAESFKLAADLLVDGIEEGNGYSTERMFYPVAYNYRHYVELSLKVVIRLGIRLQFVESANKALSGHDLEKLWRNARLIIEAFFPTGEREPVDAAEQIIAQFHALDRNGQGFRYARSKQDQTHLGNCPDLVNLLELRKVMKGLANFLDGCTIELSMAADHQDEMDRDCR